MCDVNKKNVVEKRKKVIDAELYIVSELHRLGVLL